MKTMNLGPMLGYNRKGSTKALLIFLLVIAIVVMAIPMTLTLVGDEEMSFSCFTTAAFVFALVAGIVSIRECLRLGIQLGVGRPTVAVATMVDMIYISAALALCSEVLLLLGSDHWLGLRNITYYDVYPMLYLGDDPFPMSAGQHISSLIWMFTLLAASFSFGVMISMAFYRLNKAGKVILAVGMPVAFLSIIGKAAEEGEALGNWLIAAPSTLIIIFLVLAVICSMGAWLLIRRAPIYPAK